MGSWRMGRRKGRRRKWEKEENAEEKRKEGTRSNKEKEEQKEEEDGKTIEEEMSPVYLGDMNECLLAPRKQTTHLIG